MTEKMSYVARILNVPTPIREDTNDSKRVTDKEKINEDDDLIFGALDDEKSTSIDEGIHFPSEELERTNSSISTADDEWENILPLTEADASVNQVQSTSEKFSFQQIVGMANFRSKHRLHRLTKPNSLVNWHVAAKKAAQLEDPWLDFQVDQYPEEIVTRHEFDPVKRTWHTSQIKVKIESIPFAHGSMRECFRLKKLSITSTPQDWDRSGNYIAKRYIEDVPMARYFDDVMMQMTTKLWATYYNEHNPPKKVDIVQMSVLEFQDRPGRPYYHLEGFIDGNYIKYNSNSGFVCDDNTLRHTPQAFSHFTFEASCHEQIVVDIQGVGDLYTDPQIHTNLGFEYGEGNLGIRGMALFFSTHECNPICTRLNLTPFDLSPAEREKQLQQHTSSPSYTSSISAPTACRGSEAPFNGLSKLGSLFRRLRSPSSISEDESDGYVSETSSVIAATGQLLDRSLSIPERRQFMTTFSEDNVPLLSSITKLKIPLLGTVKLPNWYSRSQSDSASNSEDIQNVQSPDNFGENHRASSVMLEKEQIEKFNQISTLYENYNSILGKIHFEMCKCYQVGRFSESGSEEFDESSTFYHLEQASELLVKEAIFALAKVYLDLPRDLLPNYQPKDQTDQYSKGVNLMIRASELQETEANLYLAQIYDKGVDNSIEQDWNQAVKYYEKYIQIRENESNNIDEDSETNESSEIKPGNNAIPFHDQHEIVARLATLYKTGGFNLSCNYQKSGDLFNKAAEMATAAMKGRLANKYYQSAEEAYALQPDEEDENS